MTRRAGRLPGAALALGGALLFFCGCGAALTTVFGEPGPGVPERAVVDNVLFEAPAEDTCGPTALAMLLRFYGKAVDTADLVRETRTEGLRGVLITDLAAAAAKRGVPMDVERLDARRLREAVARKTPVIVLLDLGYWRVSIPRYVVVYGYTPHSVIAHSGKDAGKEIAYAELDRQWAIIGNLALVPRGPGR